jgi:hypothetical protein
MHVIEIKQVAFDKHANMQTNSKQTANKQSAALPLGEPAQHSR